GPIADLRDGSEQPIQPPTSCPACGSMVIREEGEIAYYCSNPDCPERLVRTIEYFVSRSAMDIEGLGERIVRQLVAEGLVRDVADIYYLTAEQLVPLEGFAEKKAENILTAIDASRSRPLARVLTALGIRGVGNVVVGLLTEHYPSIDALAAASREELEAIEGLGPHTAGAIVEFFSEARNRRLIEKLRAGGVKLTTELKSAVSNKLAGLTFVLTGTLPTLTREQVTALIEAHGGRVTSTVSKNTDYVVAGEAAGSKLDKARSLGIPVLDEAGLQALITEGGEPD
ncbi:MAG: helix-hairpin-helix domain-containing protein, partial [Candidatus Hadarchaeum sp.]